jgi:hypothetical protein
MTSELVFRSASFARPIEVKKTSPHPLLKGQLLVNLAFVGGYVKLQPSHTRAIEAVCAWLGLEIGLPIPEPVFVTVLQDRLPNNCPWPFKETSRLCLGSIAIAEALPIRHSNEGAIATALLKWPKLVDAAVFDQLIANDDRSEENLLLDTGQNFWLIDHGRALDGGGEKLFSDDYFPLFQNKLLANLKTLPLPDRVKRKDSIILACAKLHSAVDRIPFDALDIAEDLSEQIRKYLQHRCQQLSPVIFRELGYPELDLPAQSLTGRTIQ